MSTALRAGTVLYGSAILFDRLLALLLLPLLTRAIGPADYGAWTQSLAAAALLMPLVLFAFPTAIVRSFSGAAGAPWRRRFFGRLGGVALLLLALCAAVLLGVAEPFARLIYGESGRQGLLPALLAMLAADAGVEFGVAWLRATGHMGWIAGVLIARSALRYAVVWVLVAGGGVPLVDWIGPYAVAQCMLALLVLAGTALSLRVQEPAGAAASPAPTLRELLAFSAPLVALAVFTAVGASADRFVLVRLIGLDGVAVYAAAMSISMVPAVFYSVLGFTLFPVLARHWQAREFAAAASLTDRALQVFLFLCLPVAGAMALAGPLLLPLLTTEAYRSPPGVFVLLGLSVTAFGVYQILLYTLLLDGRSAQVLALAMAAAGVNLVLNLGLAPAFGATGAAAAAALSHMLLVALAARLARQAMAWRFPWQRLWPLAWRAALALAPLAAAQAAGAAAPTALLLGLAGVLLYLALDLGRRGSLARLLLNR